MSAAQETNWLWGLYRMLGGTPRPAAVEDTAVTPEMAGPVLAQPDTVEPDVAEPDVAEPDVAEPDTTEPNAAEPNAAEPDAAEPDAAGPDAAGPDTVEPDVVELAKSELALAAEPTKLEREGGDQKYRMSMAEDLLKARIIAVKRKRDLAELNDAKAEFESQPQVDN